MNPKLLILPVLLQALVLTGCEAGDDAGSVRPAEEAPAGDASSAEAAGRDSSPAEATSAEASPVQTLPTEPMAAEEGGNAGTPPGKPTAPISIDYQVIGTPVIGQPVNVNLNVKSSVTDRRVTLSYRINDASSLAFPEDQAQRVPLGAASAAQPVNQQVTVVPQREGRVYLNVSAEVDTGEGTMLKSIAIPIQVGATPGGRQPNGEVVRDADGDPVVSLPADDR